MPSAPDLVCSDDQIHGVARVDDAGHQDAAATNGDGSGLDAGRWRCRPPPSLMSGFYLEIHAVTYLRICLPGTNIRSRKGPGLAGCGVHGGGAAVPLRRSHLPSSSSSPLRQHSPTTPLSPARSSSVVPNNKLQGWKKLNVRRYCILLCSTLGSLSGLPDADPEEDEYVAALKDL